MVCRSKTLAALRLAQPRYPRREFSDDPQRVQKSATLSAHQKRKNVSAETATEALPKFPFRLDVERWVPFSVKRTATNVLATRTP
jgi:hypothetical protein